jgi:RNA polymerase sigma-70 factor (sigma-E family)
VTDSHGMNGEQAAFCRAECPRLVGTLTLYCGDRHLAEELAQEALARACRSWPRVQTMTAPGAWVHRVAINLANRHFRRRRVALGAVRRHASSISPVHDDGDVAAAVAVRAAVAALPLRQRTALVLRYYSDLPVAQVAAAMGCAEGTVKALTHKAVGALRAHGGLLDTSEVIDER